MKKTLNVWIDFSELELEGLKINDLEECIKSYIHQKYPNCELVNESITIQSKDYDYYSIEFYFHCYCKYKQSYIEEKRVEYQIKLNEYNKWLKENKQAIEDELEKRKKKEQHNSKIRELQAQIQVLKEKKRKLQDA